MTMLLQAALQSGAETIQTLLTKYSVAAKRHKKFPSLVMFKYNQIASPMHEPIVQECRGVILDEAQNWRVISRPFDKFFNYGDPLAAKIDWATAKVQEKLDGSLCILFWYKGEWRISSSGLPDASGSCQGHDDFADLFQLAFTKAGGYAMPSSADRAFTFCFEVMTPFNMVVVHHTTYKIALIGVRETESGKHRSLTEESTEDERDRGIGSWRDANDKRYPIPQEFTFDDFDAIVKSYATLNPMEQEGYIVMDANFNRVKMKSPDYLAMHHAVSSASPKNFLELIRRGETAEMLTAFPHWKEELDRITGLYMGLVAELKKLHDDHKNITRQKEFAMQLNSKTRFSGPLFKLRKLLETYPSTDPELFFKEFIKEMPIKSLMAHLNVVDTDDEEKTS